MFLLRYTMWTIDTNAQALTPGLLDLGHRHRTIVSLRSKELDMEAVNKHCILACFCMLCT